MQRDRAAHGGSRHARSRGRGFTIVELLMVVAIVAVLAAIAMPKYADYQERIRVNHAITEIKGINTRVRLFMQDSKVPPNSLAEIGITGKLDPWGRPYQYLRLAGVKGVTGKARKNKNLVPINSDFDLYSLGKDGQTAGPLTAKASQDDVVLANDGRFVGLGKDYD